MYLRGSFYPPHWLALFFQIALKKGLALHLDVSVSSIIVIMMRCGVLRLSVRFHLLYDALFLFKSEVVMKPIICNHGNNSAVMPSKKSCSSPGVLEPDQCLCRSHGDRQCWQRHIFPGKLSLASRHLPQQWRERHLFGFPAEIQCGIFSFQRGTLWLFSRDYELTTTTDRRWRPHVT